MKYAVIGSRYFTDYAKLSHELDKLDIDMIITGGAIGADTLANKYGHAHEIRMKIYVPDYHLYGDIAPLVRNRIIVEEADAVIAFWDGKSNGTKYTLNYAKRRKKQCLVFLFRACP